MVTARGLIPILLILGISAALLGQSGPCAAATMVGPLSPINDGGAWWIDLCYNGHSDQYLALYVTGGTKARRVDAGTGGLVGSEITISPLSGSIIGKTVYNSVNHEWFVAYQRNVNNQDEVMGQRIASDGTLVGGPIDLVIKSGYQNEQEIAHDPVNNRYLLVWKQQAGSAIHYYGRFFNVDGSPAGAEFAVRNTSALYGSYEGKVVYNPVAREFLVVWLDYRNYNGVGQDNGYGDIYGQRFDASTMAKIGGNINIYVPGTPYVQNGQDMPKHIVCANDGRYMIAVQKLPNAGYYETYGLLINSDGSWSGAGLFDVSQPDNGVPTGLDYDASSNTYCFTYEDLTNADIVRGRQFTANGAPIGSVFTANTVSGGTVRDGSLAVRPSDGMYLQIASADQNGIIYGQRFVMEPDTFAPGGVNPLRAYRQSATTVRLNWANPRDTDFAGTMIRYRADTYPISETDGTLLCNRAAAAGTDDSFTHTVAPGQLYYYAAFTYDNTPNYSDGANAIPSAVWLYEPFDTYLNGLLGGQGGWRTEAAKISCAVQDSVRVGESGRAVEMLGTSTIYDDATAANFWPISAGYHKISFDMRRNAAASGNQAIVAVYGGAQMITRVYWGTTFAMLHGTGVSFTDLVTSPASGQWYHVEIGIDVTNRTLDAWVDGVQKVSGKPFYQAGTQIDKINLTGFSNATTASYIDNLKGEEVATTVSPGAPAVTAPALGSTVYTPRPRVSWTGDPHDAYEVHVNTTNDPSDGSAYDSGTIVSGDSHCDTGPLSANQTYYAFVRLRNAIGWGGWSAAGRWFAVANDGIPPAAPTEFSAIGSNGSVKLNWKNPGNADLSEVVVRYRADKYPESVSDGLLAATVGGLTPGAKASYAHTGLTNGAKYFYSVFAKDNWGLVSGPASASAAPEPWSVEYHADALPSASSPVWTVWEDGGSETYSHVEPDGGVLHVLDASTAWGSKIRWYRNWAASGVIGTTALVRAKCDSVSPDAYNANVTISDGSRYVDLLIRPDGVGAKQTGVAALDREYLLDGTAYHIYRFTMKNGAYTCYVDEDRTPVFTGTGYAIADNRVLFGSNGSGTAQSIFFDCLCYRTDGAVPPAAVAGDVLTAKSYANGAGVTVAGAVVTGAFADYFYIQTPSRPLGIRVNKAAHGLSVGDAVDVIGTMGVNSDQERFIAAASVSRTGTGSIAPFGIASAALAGGDLVTGDGLLQRGKDGGRGPNNVGLLVRTWGHVVSVDPSGAFFDIDDGSGPTKVWTEGLSEPSQGLYALVTGVCVLDASGGAPQAAIRPRTQSDIVGL